MLKNISIFVCFVFIKISMLLYIIAKYLHISNIMYWCNYIIHSHFEVGANLIFMSSMSAVGWLCLNGRSLFSKLHELHINVWWFYLFDNWNDFKHSIKKNSSHALYISSNLLSANNLIYAINKYSVYIFLLDMWDKLFWWLRLEKFCFIVLVAFKTFAIEFKYYWP